MSAVVAFSRSWCVGRYRATLSCRQPQCGAAQAAVVEWEPHTPERLNATELEQYRAGRDAALLALAEELGIRVAVVEL